MLYREMDRAQLDAAYNNSAAIPERTRLSPVGRHAVPGCGANTPDVSTSLTARLRASGSICFSPPILRRPRLCLSTAGIGR